MRMERFDSILLVTSMIVGLLMINGGEAENSIGCKFQSTLCDSVEICVDDAAFGQCQAEPFDLHQYQLNEDEQELLRLELTRLALRGDDWSSKNVQCLLHYFFLTHRYELTYDPRFCHVRNVDNIIKLLEIMEADLKNGGGRMLMDEEGNNDGIAEQEALDELPSDSSNDAIVVAARSSPADPMVVDGPAEVDQEPGFFMNPDEERRLNSYIARMIRGEQPDFSDLSDQELQKFTAYVDLLKAAVNSRMKVTTGEVVSEDELQGNPDLEKFLYKKDEERLGILDQGIAGKEHHIQKGAPRSMEPSVLLKGQRRIEGDRVYIKLGTNLTDIEQVERLMEYLEEKVGEPNNITFSDVQVFNNEVSFKVNNVDELTPEWLDTVMDKPKVNLVETLDVAGLTYNLLKKSKVPLNEVGVGNGEEDSSVPLKRADDDDEESFVLTTLIVCGLVVGSLIVVLGIYVYRSRNRAKSSLQRLAADLEGPAGKDYEELCRQRMSAKTEGPEPLSGIVGTLAQRLGSQSEPSPPAVAPHSKHSSTSSWNEEPVQTNMDISTGHMILSYMEDHLLNKDRLEQEWKELESYQPDVTVVHVANMSTNQGKNRNQQVLPYDHNRVVLNQAANVNNSDYINASFICDHDPRNPAYIAAQAPLSSTVADFWQMVWEQGSVVIVNLSKLAESGESPRGHRYWPENGSEVHHIYEIHLVSEHIWCEDYLVRSFYLKNLRTQETRTVTQFHFLTWAEDGVPSSSKALLEFRRKVNKSYRGRSCPVVVHCNDGGGRTGTYVLLDMVLNRINKGVKEIDIAAALEHVRDQRMKSIRTMEQFEFVLASVAEEVQAVLKALPQ